MPVSSIHVRKPFRRAVRILQAGVWCALIFLASAQPDLRIAHDDTVDFVLRKLAHIATFGVLAILLARAIRPDRSAAVPTLFWAWLGTLAWAASDEWHQTFVAGRVGHPVDVAIDMLGATVALAIWRSCAPRTTVEGAAS